MAGLGAVRGMFGAVLLCSILALVFLIIGLIVPDWMSMQRKNKTDLNKPIRRVVKVGLFEFTVQGKCQTDECRDQWNKQPDLLKTGFEGSCKGFLKATVHSDEPECDYHGDGYCRCPYPDSDQPKKNAEAAGKGNCKSNPKYDDYTADTAKEYHDGMSSAHRTAVIMLILAIVLVFLAIVLAVVGSITAKWILGIVGAIFLCLALIFAVVGLIMGTSYTCKYRLRSNCGSSDAWDAGNDSQSEHLQLSVNNFGAGPILVLVGILFLFIAAVLDCIVSGLAKKIHKVADIDGDGRIG